LGFAGDCGAKRISRPANRKRVHVSKAEGGRRKECERETTFRFHSSAFLFERARLYRCDDFRLQVAMIEADQELQVTRDRITSLIDLLTRLRINSRPEELASVTAGYRAEVERMQREVLDDLTQPQTAQAG
jgi:hypothetical protein